MKTILVKTLSLLLISTALFSFAPAPGGEGFEVLVNGKVVLQRFGNDVNKPHVLRFAAGTENDEVTIKYYHCGQPGKNRVLTIKDGQDNVLRQISFGNEANGKAGMSCKVKDIISLRKGNITSLRLYYSSDELPAGKLLVSILSDNAAPAVKP
ncbi:MAG: hypothetical protein U0U70_11580 [Chitinophagaceae bacterium]